MRILSGIQPSGAVHVGNYFGMMLPAVELQEKGEAYLFIADYHALTSSPAPDALRERIEGVAADFLACGLNPDKTVFFRQSDIPQIPELTWILSCVTPMGLLERCHSYKDKVAHGISPNHGLFAYPVLMAADILMYDSNIVPVGKDQKQHVEVTRDIAQRFNGAYGEIFTIPEPQIKDEVAVVPGTDGQKMSKTYDNTLELFGDEKALKKKIMSIITDSTPVEAPKDPEKCNVFAIYKLLASPQQVEAMRGKYAAGNYGYGHAKKELLEAFMEYFKPLREKRRELIADKTYLASVLRKGAEKAGATAARTMKRVRAAVGL